MKRRIAKKIAKYAGTRPVAKVDREFQRSLHCQWLSAIIQQIVHNAETAMQRKSSIPDSQRMRARNVARRAWRESMGDAARAKDKLSGYLSREIGQCWLREATDNAELLIEHWEENAVTNPMVEWIEGEPV